MDPPGSTIGRKEKQERSSYFYFETFPYFVLSYFLHEELAFLKIGGISEENVCILLTSTGPVVLR